MIAEKIKSHFNPFYSNGDDEYISHIRKNRYSCVLLDYHLELKNSLDILYKISEVEGVVYVPVIMITGEKRPDIVAECMKNGASDYLVKGEFSSERVIFVINQAIEKFVYKKKVHEQQRTIFKLSMTDELTGVLNRRAVLHKVEDEINRCKRDAGSFSLSMIDLDNLKVINDNYGHLAGDERLGVFVKIIENEIRNSDYIGRYGGDEFILILLAFKNRSKKEIVRNHGAMLRRIQKKINEYNGGDLPMTASIGFCIYDRSIEDVADMIEDADRALYQAKNSGKNAIFYNSYSDIKLVGDFVE